MAIEQKQEIDWTEVIDTAQSVINDVEAGTWHEDNDNAYYMYESVMTAIYGENVFELIEGVLDDQED